MSRLHFSVEGTSNQECIVQGKPTKMEKEKGKMEKEKRSRNKLLNEKIRPKKKNGRTLWGNC